MVSNTVSSTAKPSTVAERPGDLVWEDPTPMEQGSMKRVFVVSSVIGAGLAIGMVLWLVLSV
jgi:hypothetical protein